MKLLLTTIFFSFILLPASVNAQPFTDEAEQRWVDSVFQTLSHDQKIAQLMVIRAHSNLGNAHVAQVAKLVDEYNVGALCFFQGGPVRQANLTNYYQALAKTPLMITTDGEWGLGMRLDSITNFPYQLALGALRDPGIVYQMGVAVGEQMKRLGVHVNYAPVVDVNNNPANPVIGYRSFGSDPDKVAMLGVAYMKGMQDAGIYACAKHFPGHGDTDVDSHLDLPVIKKSMAELDSVELKPFRAMFEAGVGSVMIAHLSIPSIDNTRNLPSSLSEKNVTELLRMNMGFNGLSFTDALEMKGVTKYFPGGEAAVLALEAGNDMLCLPEDVPEAISAVKKAIRNNRLEWSDIDEKVRRVLIAKYRLGLANYKPVDLTNLTEDLNRKTDAVRYLVARNNMTLVRGELPSLERKKIAYVGIGAAAGNRFGNLLNEQYGADRFYFSYKFGSGDANALFNRIKAAGYDHVIIGIHDYSNRPSNNYNISNAAVSLWHDLQKLPSTTVVFGNVYAIGNFCEARSLIAAHHDDEVTAEVAYEVLSGRTPARGALPVSVCRYPVGTGTVTSVLPSQGFSLNQSLYTIDSIVYDAIYRKAFPGCVVLAARGGELIYHKAFGNYEYQGDEPVTLQSIYDLASVTKVSATTLAVMKLYEEGKLDLRKTIGDYLDWVQGTDKAKLRISDILLHQAGLDPFIPFYKETIDESGAPVADLYNRTGGPGYIPVADNLFMRADWNDTMYKRILLSPLGPPKRYVYSDNDFIFLGKIIEAISGQTLDQYVREHFYKPMGLVTTGFRPRDRFPVERIVPTEFERHFRQQLLRGFVHDEGASMFGGVAGHAGLFSTAYDLSMLYQMLLNGGVLNGVRYLKPETIKLFTAYQTPGSRRGLGFDKPEIDKRKDPYPASMASSKTFGHTGFTGTAVWVDPEYDLVYIFLSNRVYPSRNNPLLSQLDVREKIHDAIYTVLQQEQMTASRNGESSRGTE